jgi:hypothetical protein
VARDYEELGPTEALTGGAERNARRECTHCAPWDSVSCEPRPDALGYVQGLAATAGDHAIKVFLKNEDEAIDVDVAEGTLKIACLVQ